MRCTPALLQQSESFVCELCRPKSSCCFFGAPWGDASN
jgi:hypothetical protein